MTLLIYILISQTLTHWKLNLFLSDLQVLSFCEAWACSCFSWSQGDVLSSGLNFFWWVLICCYSLTVPLFIVVFLTMAGWLYNACAWFPYLEEYAAFSSRENCTYGLCVVYDVIFSFWIPSIYVHLDGDVHVFFFLLTTVCLHITYQSLPWYTVWIFFFFLLMHWLALCALWLAYYFINSSFLFALRGYLLSKQKT